MRPLHSLPAAVAPAPPRPPRHTHTNTGPNIADRTYTNLNDAAAEAGNSRIFAGAHWAQANNDAFAIGKAVGEYIYDNIDKLIYGKQAPLKW